MKEFGNWFNTFGSSEEEAHLEKTETNQLKINGKDLSDVATVAGCTTNPSVYALYEAPLLFNCKPEHLTQETKDAIIRDYRIELLKKTLVNCEPIAPLAPVATLISAICGRDCQTVVSYTYIISLFEDSVDKLKQERDNHG